jgi:hypothetical protein
MKSKLHWSAWFVAITTVAIGGFFLSDAFARHVNGPLVTVNLTKVTNAQTVTITLTNVSDNTNTGNVSLPMAVLAGDTNADTFVNSADITQTKSQSGSAVTSSNFREDLNTDGFINSADITLVKSKSGTALP